MMEETHTTHPARLRFVRKLSATAATKAALEQIRVHNPTFNCFTTVLEQQALQQSQEIDRRIAAGQDPGPLAGVPFAVKNLFDVAGVTRLWPDPKFMQAGRRRNKTRRRSLA